MRIRYKIIAVSMIIIVFIGIIKINTEYNKLNGKTFDRETYVNVFNNNDKTGVDIFNEFVIDRKKGTKIRMYFTKSPFDLRFTVGNKILYINGTIIDNIYKKITEVKSALIRH